MKMMVKPIRMAELVNLFSLAAALTAPSITAAQYDPLQILVDDGPRGVLEPTDVWQTK
jgi:hypothetical protein